MPTMFSGRVSLKKKRAILPQPQPKSRMRVEGPMTVPSDPQACFTSTQKRKAWVSVAGPEHPTVFTCSSALG